MLGTVCLGRVLENEARMTQKAKTGITLLHVGQQPCCTMAITTRGNMKNPLSMTISLLLATGIVGTGIYVMSRSVSDISPKVGAAKMAGKSENLTVEHFKPDASGTETMEAHPALSSGIVKCVENGKATYSNQPCGTNSKTQFVDLHDTHGVVSPTAEQVAAADRRIEARKYESGPSVVSSTSTAPQRNYFTCAALSSQINSIDEATRNRMDAYQMQELRIQRSAARTQQYRQGC